MLRCTFFGYLTASTPKASTEPASGTTSVETTRTSVLFPLPFGPRIPTTSPSPTASETESRARTTSPRPFLKLFSTCLNSRAFTEISLSVPLPSRGGRLYNRPLASSLSQTKRQVSSRSAATARSKSRRAALARREDVRSGQVLLTKSAILHPIQHVPVHLSVSLLPSSLVAAAGRG